MNNLKIPNDIILLYLLNLLDITGLLFMVKETFKFNIFNTLLRSMKYKQVVGEKQFQREFSDWLTLLPLTLTIGFIGDP